jgi:hypothetical protein
MEDTEADDELFPKGWKDAAQTRASIGEKKNKKEEMVPWELKTNYLDDYVPEGGKLRQEFIPKTMTHALREGVVTS